MSGPSLDEAFRLKEEAQKVLAEYRRRHEEADREADAIIASARTEAERVAAEAKTKMEEFVARRTRMADTKIAQAEAASAMTGECLLRGEARVREGMGLEHAADLCLCAPRRGQDLSIPSMVDDGGPPLNQLVGEP
jgi:ATP synthase B/B' CF(0)